MSIEAHRPRSTICSDVAKTSAATIPVFLSYSQPPSRPMSSSARRAETAEGSRAAHSSIPPSSRPNALIAQKKSGGLSV